MIFFAVAGPTPGSWSSSFSVAVFRSTFDVSAEGRCATFDCVNADADRTTTNAIVIGTLDPGCISLSSKGA